MAGTKALFFLMYTTLLTTALPLSTFEAKGTVESEAGATNMVYADLSIANQT